MLTYNKNVPVFFTEAQIKLRVKEIAAEISKEFGDEEVVCEECEKEKKNVG